MEYIGYWITHKGIKLVKKESTINMKSHKNRKFAWEFIGLVDYYCYMWTRRLHKLTNIECTPTDFLRRMNNI